MVGKHPLVPFILAAIVPMAPGQTVASSCFVEQGKLTASDAGIGDAFGHSVSVFDDTALVGAFGAGADGSAYVYVRSGEIWIEEAELTISDVGQQELWFGESVSLFRDTALVGAPAPYFAHGRAYVFVRSGTTWTREAKLSPSGGTDSRFGKWVAVYGDTALVSGEDSTFVFVRNGTIWTEEVQLVPGGGAVSLYGDRALVAAAGVVHVFVRSGTNWTEEAQLVPSDWQSDDGFGASVSLWGDSALVGAPYDDDNGSASGSAYVFVWNGTDWTEEAKLTAIDGEKDDVFGQSVSLFDVVALVGARGDDDNGSSSGSAYVFVRNGTTWTEELKLTPTDGEVNELFGSSASLFGDTALVGAQADDSKGSAYVFEALSSSAYCTAGVSASGCQALLSASGCASATASSGFTLSAATVEGQKDGLFFFGTNGQQANPWGNGTSYQCVVPPVVRAGTLAGTGTVGLCDGSFAQDLNALWCPSCPKPAKNPGPGATVQAQLWYRDPLSTSNQTTSLSDAIEFEVGPR
jgi:hypothetical protein